MRIQEVDGYTFDIRVAWLAQDQLQFEIVRMIDGQEYRQDYYFTPQELERLAEYINDRLCL